MPKAQVGLIGLAVMGENLALNIERNGFPIAVYNRTGSVTERYIAGPAKGKPGGACLERRASCSAL